MSALHNVQRIFPGVTKVIDAKKNAKFEVTKADNRSSTVRNHIACAAAVACKRLMELDGVIMSINTAYLVKGTTATRYKVPESIGREITVFDRQKDGENKISDAAFEPGEYHLKAPSKFERLGADKGSNKGSNANSHSGGLAKRFRHKTGGIRASLGSKEVV